VPEIEREPDRGHPASAQLALDRIASPPASATSS